MAISVTAGMDRLSFADRPDFSDPYPEGIAVAHRTVTGDATGGGITVSILDDSGFLYRLEMISAIRGDSIADGLSIITAHRWAADRAPNALPTNFNLNWVMGLTAGPTFGVYRLGSPEYEMVRRFPIGRTDDVELQQLFAFFQETNTDTIVYEFDIVCSYWRKEALQRPGFLTAFYETPVVARVAPFGR